MEKVKFVETLIKFPDETFMSAEGKKRIAVLLKADLLYECKECCCILVSPSEPHNCPDLVKN